MRRRAFVFLCTLLPVGCDGSGYPHDARRYDATALIDAGGEIDAPASDAATIDASASDAATIDAVQMDAATPDSKVADAVVADAVIADAATPDSAPPDAQVGCFPTGDHVEMDEAGNDAWSSGTPESTGLVFAPGDAPYTIGGCVATDQTSGGTADDDFYEFTVATATSVQFELEWSYPHPSIHWLTVTDDGGSVIGAIHWNGSTTGRALTLPAVLSPGTYSVVVDVEAPAPTVEYAYQVTIREATSPCDASASPADYIEADESSAGHRANDMAAVTWAGTTSVVATAAADSPEASGVVLLPGMSYRLTGDSADIGSDGDDYLDRDTFAVTAGPGTTELHVRLDWPSTNVDMDLFVFAGDVAAIAGTGVTYTFGEQAIVAADPSTTYWIWAATFDENGDESPFLPFDYDITICAR